MSSVVKHSWRGRCVRKISVLNDFITTATEAGRITNAWATGSLLSVREVHLDYGWTTSPNDGEAHFELTFVARPGFWSCGGKDRVHFSAARPHAAAILQALRSRLPASVEANSDSVSSTSTSAAAAATLAASVACATTAATLASVASATTAATLSSAEARRFQPPPARSPSGGMRLATWAEEASEATGEPTGEAAVADGAPAPPPVAGLSSPGAAPGLETPRAIESAGRVRDFVQKEFHAELDFAIECARAGLEPTERPPPLSSALAPPLSSPLSPPVLESNLSPALGPTGVATFLPSTPSSSHSSTSLASRALRSGLPLTPTSGAEAQRRTPRAAPSAKPAAEGHLDPVGAAAWS